jgi:hypothetical protein
MLPDPNRMELGQGFRPQCLDNATELTALLTPKLAFASDAIRLLAMPMPI